MNRQVIPEIQDLRRHDWSKIRHSSGTAGAFLNSREIIRGGKWYYKLSEYDAYRGIDFLILNRDRHGANMEVLRSRSEKSYRLAPLFDQGLSLFCSIHEEKELENADPMADRRVQCFVGSGSAVQNLRLIPRDYMRVPGTPCRAYNAARRAWNHNIR